MPLQLLTLKLDGITAGDYLTWCRDPEPPALDYLTWCRDPEPPALDYALRSISIDAGPLEDTITAILDWNQTPPPSRAAASAAGLPLSTGVQIAATLPESSHPTPPVTDTVRLGVITCNQRPRVLMPAEGRELAGSIPAGFASNRPAGRRSGVLLHAGGQAFLDPGGCR